MKFNPTLQSVLVKSKGFVVTILEHTVPKSIKIKWIVLLRNAFCSPFKIIKRALKKLQPFLLSATIADINGLWLSKTELTIGQLKNANYHGERTSKKVSSVIIIMEQSDLLEIILWWISLKMSFSRFRSNHKGRGSEEVFFKRSKTLSLEVYGEQTLQC